MAKDKVQSSNKSMKISAHGQILKRKQTNSKKYNVTQKVLKKYNLRVKPCPLRQYLIQKQKTGNSKALQNETSGNNKDKVQSSNKSMKISAHGQILKRKQTNSKKYNVTQKVLKKYNLRVKPCPLRQYLIQKQKTGNSKALQNETSGNNKDKVQSSNKSMKISAHGQILKRKQTNSKKYNVTQKVLKKYNLRVKPCPLRQYLIRKQKTGNSKALQNETSGNNKDKVQSSNKSMKISAHGQILKRKQTNSKKYNVTQKVLKKYNLRVKPCPLRQYLIKKQKTGNSKALQNETSGNNKIGMPSPKAHMKRLYRRKLHKSTQTDISMTFATGNIPEEYDFLVASCSKGQHEQCAIKKKPGNIRVLTGADRKNTGSTASLMQAIPSTSTAKPHSLPEISATVSSKRSACVMTDEVITVQRAVAATQALQVPQRNAAVMTEKIITHDKTVSARLPLKPPKRNVAVMTDIVDEKIGNKSNQASKHGKRSAAKTSRKEDDIILISNASTSDTDVPQKKDVGVMTDGFVKICLHAHEILDDLSDVMDLE